MRLYFSKLDSRATIPKYATAKSSGFDFHALEDITIQAGETKLVKTGLACVLPANTELQVRPRSGCSLKTSLRIANSPGTVDEDYLEQDIGIICWNPSEKPLTIKAGDKIAQGVIAPVLRPTVIEANEEFFGFLSKSRKTDRTGGFGSTDTKDNE